MGGGFCCTFAPESLYFIVREDNSREMVRRLLLLLVLVLSVVAGIHAQYNRAVPKLMSMDAVEHPFKNDSDKIVALIQKYNITGDSILHLNQKRSNDYIKGHTDEVPLSAFAVVPDSVYHIWRQIINLSPCNHYKYYENALVEYVLAPLIYYEKDPAIKMLYFDDIMEIQKKHIDCNEIINRMRVKINMAPITIPDAKALYAHYYYKYRDVVPAKIYSDSIAYANYAEAFREVCGASVDAQTEIEPYMLLEYYQASQNLFESDREKYMEMFLTSYQSCIESCVKMESTSKLIEDKDKSKEQWANFFASHQSIQRAFSETGVGTVQNLTAYYRPLLNSHRSDLDFLNKALDVMIANRALDSQIGYDYSDAAYSIQPSYASALGSALMYRQEDMREEMKKCFAEAYNFAHSSENKAFVAYTAGLMLGEGMKELAKVKDSVDVWRMNLLGVIDYMKKARELNPNKYSVRASYSIVEASYLLSNQYTHDDKTLNDRLNYYKTRRKQCDEARMLYQEAVYEYEDAVANKIYQQEGIAISDLCNWIDQYGNLIDNRINELDEIIKRLPKPTYGGPCKTNHAEWIKYYKLNNFWEPEKARGSRCPTCNVVLIP